MRQHDLLADEPQQVAIGLRERRPAPAQQLRLELAHITGEQRRQRQHEQHLAELHERVEGYCHIASTISSTTSAPKTSVR